jgi:hypothetical protein
MTVGHRLLLLLLDEKTGAYGTGIRRMENGGNMLGKWAEFSPPWTTWKYLR